MFVTFVIFVSFDVILLVVEHDGLAIIGGALVAEKFNCTVKALVISPEGS